MSFASDVRKELIRHYTKVAHCRKAELAAILLFEGRMEDGETLFLQVEDPELVKKSQTALKKLFDIDADSESMTASKKNPGLVISGGKALEQLAGQIPFSQKTEKEAEAQLEKILGKTCCRRAFLRGAFTAAGTLSDPEKQYHLEIVCGSAWIAEYICTLLSGFQITARISVRRGKSIVYIKDAVEIADMLNVMEAHVSLMNFENIRIVREMRGNVNRKVNCEAANIEKTVTAAMRQIEDIAYINDTIGLSELDESLRQIAKVRLDHPDIPLSRLGDMLEPPVGKSGVNHRLRRISQIAAKLRAEKEAGEKEIEG